MDLPDCAACGACCREAYHAIELDPDEVFLTVHPELVVQVDGRFNLRRDRQRCSCLLGEPGNFSCRIYATRPQTCRDFELGGENCRDARLRLGLEQP